MDNKIKDLYQVMKDEYKNSTIDMEKFCEGNHSAGTRVRKSMQTLKTLAQEVRAQVQEQKNSVLA